MLNGANPVHQLVLSFGTIASLRKTTFGRLLHAGGGGFHQTGLRI